MSAAADASPQSGAAANAAHAGNAPTTPPPLTGTTLALGTLSLSLATFMNVLDSTIANVSIPAIAGDMGVSPTQGTWVITSFGVANAVSVPLTGWLTQRFGAVRLFTTSVVLFVLASWLCGFAPTLEWLVFFRVLQGLVAGPMMPLSQTLLMSSYPPARVGMALALWGMTTLVAPVAGPLLGGWITDNFSWPWIFYINVPVGLAAAALTWSIYRKRETPVRKLPIDTIGLALLVLWIGSLQLMLDLGKEYDWFAHPAIITLALVALVGFAFFLVWELTDKHPVVDLRLFARRNFGFGVATLSVAYGLFFGNVVLLPLWLQQWMGYDATAAGMALAPVGLLAIVLTPLVGRKVGQWDPRWMATFAFAMFALVMGQRAGFTPQSDFAHILVPTVLQGAAVAFFFIPLTTLSLAGIGPERLPAAAGLSNFVRMTAGAFGVSVSTTLWESRAQLHRAHLVERLGAGDPALQQALAALQAGGLDATQAMAQLSRLIDQQVFTRAANDIFLVSSWIFIGLTLAVWLMQRPSAVFAASGAGGAARGGPATPASAMHGD
ncbi:MAG: DHA2 family efflux MFS transporter permease subunit [Betaproteobacteria bacterium]|nr:DHA2 family efflux MFS transporter permease subunit [Betaproteobacteria bacterium]